MRLTYQERVEGDYRASTAVKQAVKRARQEFDLPKEHPITVVSAAQRLDSFSQYTVVLQVQDTVVRQQP